MSYNAATLERLARLLAAYDGQIFAPCSRALWRAPSPLALVDVVEVAFETGDAEVWALARDVRADLVAAGAPDVRAVTGGMTLDARTLAAALRYAARQLDQRNPTDTDSPVSALAVAFGEVADGLTAQTTRRRPYARAAPRRPWEARTSVPARSGPHGPEGGTAREVVDRARAAGGGPCRSSAMRSARWRRSSPSRRSSTRPSAPPPWPRLSPGTARRWCA